MKKKINTLIITSIVVLLALIALQVYIVYNANQLDKNSFLLEARKSVSTINNTVAIESLHKDWYEKLANDIVKYTKKEIQKKEVLDRLALETTSVNKSFKKSFLAGIQKSNLEYDLKYKKKIRSIVLFSTKNRDTIFSSSNDKKQFLLGDDFSDREGDIISGDRWYKEYNDGTVLQKPVLVEIKTEDLISSVDGKSGISTKMMMIFIFSAVIFLIIVSLFFNSIKNLLTQKKIEDVKTDFINNITYELKTPLATLGAASKKIGNSETQNSPELFSDTLAVIDRQNNRLQKTIDQVVNNSLNEEQIVLKKEEILDDTYFRDVLKDFKLSVTDKNVDLQSKIEGREVQLDIDTFMFTTALVNVLDNAVKYGKEPVEIMVRSYLRADHYEVSIHDNGIGISEGEQRKVFQKFYQADREGEEKVRGLGLGLYYAKNIVKAHSGSIILESKADLGTTITIKLPLLEE